MKTLLKFLLIVVLPVAAFGQQAPFVSLDILISKDQQQKMGIQKLTAEEQEALRQQIVVLLTAAYTKGKQDAATTKQITTPALNATSLKALPTSKRNVSTGEGHWIKENIERGTYILLEDGTLWEIDPLDKIDASLWLRISNITVVDSTTGSPGYDYLLINTDDKETAHAKYIGKK